MGKTARKKRSRKREYKSWVQKKTTDATTERETQANAKEYRSLAGTRT